MDEIETPHGAPLEKRALELIPAKPSQKNQAQPRPTEPSQPASQPKEK